MQPIGRRYFLPWHARPERDELWYNLQRADILARTGSTDDLHQEYPASDTEALSPRTLDKRIPAPWLEACYVELEFVVNPNNAPALANLTILCAPRVGRHYVLGADPAEGNPTSDDSALTVLDVLTGEECAVLAGKLEPGAFASACNEIGLYYNGAPVLVERNNHGHSVLLWLREHSRLLVLPGLDGREGWLSSALGKATLYTQGAEMFRDKQTILHSFATYMQLASIEGNTLLAPKGQHDDLADSYVLANMARVVLAALEALPPDGVMVQDEPVRISPF